MGNILNNQNKIFLVTIFCNTPNLNTYRGQKYEEEIREEMLELCYTASLDVVNKGDPVVIILKEINPKTFISRGNIDNIKEKIKNYKIQFLGINIDISPSQQKNLNSLFNVKVITKTEIIYEIFYRRASSSVSKIQIELANLKYIKSRLVGSYEDFDRIRGGIGIKGGAGETKLEIDRRNIDKRISLLKKKLSKIEKHFHLIYGSHRDIYTVSIVGYTNAGKSTLLNALTNADQLEEDLLFSTLEVKSKKLFFNSELSILLVDTIGFIRDLPHHLVESFKTTLLEIKYSKLLLHVVDASSEFIEDHIETVNNTLEDINCKDIPRILVFNKCDKIDPIILDNLKIKFPDSFFISAKNKTNLFELKDFLYKYFYSLKKIEKRGK
ncbi:MAG: GTPase HflX [Spirochaetes bacterium]|nr:GTPase HflX [Spirochaetota bacterium]